MNRKSVTQEYYVLATNEKGNMPAMHSEESKAGIVVAGMMDLLLKDTIRVEKKKITVIKEKSNELEHISSLYTYLNEKPRSTDKLMSDYMAGTGSRIKKLTTELGESLLTDHSATKGEGGLFGNKTTYIPEKSYKDEVIGIVKSALMKDEEIAPHDMALICILKETKNLKQYFSEHESASLKAKLKEIKKNPQNKQLADMINYVSDMTAVMAACIVTSAH